MIDILKKNTFLIFFCIIVSIISSLLQVKIPFYVAKIFEEFNDSDIKKTLFIFALIYLLKSFFELLAKSYIFLLQNKVRVEIVRSNLEKNSKTNEMKITILKEDSERLSIAIANSMYMAGNLTVMFMTSYLLIKTNNILALPIVSFMVFSYVYIYVLAPKIRGMYLKELSSQEKYKKNVLGLIAGDSNLIKIVSSLKTVITDGFNYDYYEAKSQLYVELFTVFFMVTYLVLGYLFDSEFFTAKLLEFFGYFGLFVMTTLQFFSITYTYIGLKESMNRVS